ncbi:metal ABC transporter substrate-binding protein [Halovenus marina]|uniref:metal ABC transporter substrate-binding protein n=1 Tax=Halovenus marina TaxID=3396621 RepID=UPI003F546FCE
MSLTRREVLKAGVGLAGVSATAGCLDVVGLGTEASDADGYAAFFPIHDWAEAVGGERMTFENPVGTGRMGHGWSPDANITSDVAATDVFLYLDTEEFSWAQDVARNLERDYDDIAVVDLLAGLESDLISSDHDGSDESSDGHEHGGSGFHDPHVWVDPIIAQEMVGTIEAELAELDPEHATTYEENGAAYRDRLGAVDEQFTELVARSELDVAVFAGHNSFQYLERRYGFSLETPTGVSPDARASRDDIIGLIETIEDHGMDTILYDPFEAPTPGDGYPQIVESILEESPAEHAEPLTPASGTTGEWNEQGWGWVEQMEEVNIPSLEQALNPGQASGDS